MSARSRSDACATTSAALGPSPPMRMSSGPSSRNEKPRSASSSCIEDTPRSSTTPSTAAWPNFSATRSSAEKRSSTSVSRPLADCTRPAPPATALWSRSMPMTCASAAARIARRVAAGAEGAVDIDAAVAHVRAARAPAARARERDGPVRQRQQGHRCPPSFPCPERIFRRSLEAGPLRSATAMVAPMTARAKRAGPQIEKVTGAIAGTTRTSLHRPFPSIGYARRLGLFGSTSDGGRQDRSGVERLPPGNRTTDQVLKAV